MNVHPTAPMLSLRWVARFFALASVFVLLMFVFGESDSGPLPTPKEWVMLAFFPTGVIVGLLLGLRNEGLGGWVALASLALFYLVHLIVAGNVPGGFYFVVFTAPAFLFLAYWYLQKFSSHTPTPT